MTTQVGEVRAGFTLAQLSNAFRGYRIAERFNLDLGQGTDGVSVNDAGERSASASTTHRRRTTRPGG
ncbi:MULTISPECIES: hypothetical protein [Amycolatopsis]|nr:hypothetical protein [Amycolatopsis bullii]